MIRALRKRGSLDLMARFYVRDEWGKYRGLSGTTVHLKGIETQGKLLGFIRKTEKAFQENE